MSVAAIGTGPFPDPAIRRGRVDDSPATTMTGGRSDVLTKTSVWELANWGRSRRMDSRLRLPDPLNRRARLATLEPRSGQIRGTPTWGR